MYTVWTDGACQVHTSGCGGAAAVIMGSDWAIPAYHFSFHLCGTTNQRAELSAALIGLSGVPRDAEVNIRTDSQYVVGLMSGGWEPKANQILVRRVKAAAKVRKVTWTWIPRNSEIGAREADAESERISRECPETP